jgi:hypothetical protein
MINALRIIGLPLEFFVVPSVLAAWAVWTLVVEDISVTVLVLRTRQGVLDNTHSP